MKLKIIGVLLAALLLTGCTQPDRASEILAREGYNNIEILGYDWLGCSEDDLFHTGFRAEKNNVEIKGVVCSGFLKGSTIRTY